MLIVVTALQEGLKVSPITSIGWDPKLAVSQQSCESAYHIFIGDMTFFLTAENGLNLADLPFN